MANVTGTQSINLHKGKESHVVLTGPDARFKKTTKVASATDDPGNAWRGDVSKAKSDNKRLEIKLTCTTVAKEIKDDTSPETGQLTITLTDPNLTTDPPLTVTYVADSGACTP